MTDLPPTATIDRLIAEALEMIPSLTPGRGSFSTMPPGYTARYPDEWQREVLETMDTRYLAAFKPDTNDIVTLAEQVNHWTLDPWPSPTFPRHDGTLVLTPISTLATIVGYALLEMLVRKLRSGSPGPSSLDKLLRRFENDSSCADLANDLKSLNSRMRYKQLGKDINLYQRLKKGRDQLLHGNVLRTREPEGWLLVLLIDLILLHVMRYEIMAQSGVAS